jgi:hypothetical protein
MPNESERITALEGQVAALTRIVEERDRLYDMRFKAAEVAVSAALSAQEKAVAAAFLASEKAIVKAEDAQREYNVRSNEFRGQLDDQAKTLMPRSEASVLYRAVDDKMETIRANAERNLIGLKEDFAKNMATLANDITGLRLSRSEGSGMDKARFDEQQQKHWLAGMVVAVFLSLCASAVSVGIALFFRSK